MARHVTSQYNPHRLFRTQISQHEETRLHIAEYLSCQLDFDCMHNGNAAPVQQCLTFLAACRRQRSGPCQDPCIAPWRVAQYGTRRTNPKQPPVRQPRPAPAEIFVHAPQGAQWLLFSVACCMSWEHSAEPIPKLQDVRRQQPVPHTPELV